MKHMEMDECFCGWVVDRRNVQHSGARDDAWMRCGAQDMELKWTHNGFPDPDGQQVCALNLSVQFVR